MVKVMLIFILVMIHQLQGKFYSKYFKFNSFLFFRQHAIIRFNDVKSCFEIEALHPIYVQGEKLLPGYPPIPLTSRGIIQVILLFIIIIIIITYYYYYLDWM